MPRRPAVRHSPQGNLDRIIASIRDAKAAGCTFRTGPELEVTGYGCEDSFHELDTYTHAWEQLCKLLATDATDGILCDVGMPVMHRCVPPTPRAGWCAVCASRRAGAQVRSVQLPRYLPQPPHPRHPPEVLPRQQRCAHE